MTTSSLPALQQILPFLIPIVIIELALLIFALVDLTKQRVTRGPKWMWALIILFIQIIGPIVYFVAARKEE